MRPIHNNVLYDKYKYYNSDNDNDNDDDKLPGLTLKLYCVQAGEDCSVSNCMT